MDQIADKLVHNQDPLSKVADDLVYAARKTIQDYDDGVEPALMTNDLEVQVAAQLETLTRREFDTLWALVQMRVDTALDEDVVLDEIAQSIAFAAQHQFKEDGHSENGHLVTIPLALASATLTAWNPPIDSATCQAIGRVLKEFKIVAEDAKLTILPQILSPALGQSLENHDIYHLRKLLAKGDVYAAQQLVTQAMQTAVLGIPELGGPEEPAPADMDRLSFGQLAVHVETNEVSAFPLSDELNLRIGQAFGAENFEPADTDANEDQASPSQQQMKDAYADVTARLVQVAEALAPILGALFVRLIEAPSDWRTGVKACANFERGTWAAISISHLAELVKSGDLASLRYSQEWAVTGDGEGYEIAFFDVEDAAWPVGTVEWPALLDEDEEACAIAFELFIEQMDIVPL